MTERLRSLVAYFLGLLSFQGRLSRLGYWRGVLALTALTTVTLVIGYSAIIAAGPFAAILLTPMLPALLGNIAIAVRRLHDRGKSALWLLPFVVVPLGASGAAGESSRFGDPTAFAALIILGSLGLEIWGIIEIGLLSGQPGPNRYGADPKSPTPAEVFS